MRDFLTPDCKYAIFLFLNWKLTVADWFQKSPVISPWVTHKHLTITTTKAYHSRGS